MEFIFQIIPHRGKQSWESMSGFVLLPKGAIFKLIGKELTWKDDPLKFNPDFELVTVHLCIEVWTNFENNIRLN